MVLAARCRGFDSLPLHKIQLRRSNRMIKIIRYFANATVTVTVDDKGNVTTKVEPP